MRTLFILFFILLSSCGAKKESHSRQTKEMEKVVMQTENKERKEVTTGQSGQRLNIRHVEWLPPDSAGQQVVKSITSVSTIGEQREEVIVIERDREEVNIKEQTIDHREENRKINISLRIIPWGIVGILAVLSFILWRSKQ